MPDVAKVKRDAFLYLDPIGDDFAQCATCALFRPSRESCATVAGHIIAGGSCGLYANGTPDDAQPQRSTVSRAAAGYVERQVRCENCRFFDADGSLCGLYVDLDEMAPAIFDLAPRVDAQGCCNAQMPMNAQAIDKSSDRPGGTDLHINPENAVLIEDLPDGLPVADVVTRANIQHVSVEMFRAGKASTKRIVLPLELIIATQQVLDKKRVAKHEAALIEGEGLEPKQKAPLTLLWDDDYFLIGGHHGIQAAKNLGLTEVTVDLMVAPT